MNFYEKYPLANPHDKPEPSLVLSRRMGVCFVCHGLTEWVDLDFAAYVCSTDCRDKAVAEWAGTDANP